MKKFLVQCSTCPLVVERVKRTIRVRCYDCKMKQVRAFDLKKKSEKRLRKEEEWGWQHIKKES